MTIVVYTLENCGYCKVAKELLKFKKVDFKEVKVPEEMTTRDFVSTFPDVKQFPYILDETSNPIGSFSDLQEWLLNREKQQLLKEQIGGLSI
jgi:glutaredoxin